MNEFNHSDGLISQRDNVYSNDIVIVDQEGMDDLFENQVGDDDTRNAPLVEVNDTNVDLTSNHEFDLQIDQMIEKRDGEWQCKVCPQKSAAKQNLLNHAETHVVGVSHICQICGKTSSTRRTLKMHMSNNHSLVFSCDICGKSGMNKLAHKNHLNRNHK